jgi:hypothetical protein
MGSRMFARALFGPNDPRVDAVQGDQEQSWVQMILKQLCAQTLQPSSSPAQNRSQTVL